MKNHQARQPYFFAKKGLSHLMIYHQAIAPFLSYLQYLYIHTVGIACDAKLAL